MHQLSDSSASVSESAKEVGGAKPSESDRGGTGKGIAWRNADLGTAVGKISKIKIEREKRIGVAASIRFFNSKEIVKKFINSIARY